MLKINQYEYGAGGARYISRQLAGCEQERSSLHMGPRDINNRVEIRLQAISPLSKYIISAVLTTRSWAQQHLVIAC